MANQGLRLIVGLGNPGLEYENTRHNAGVWFVNEIAQANNVLLRHDKKFKGFHGVTQIDHQECHLLIPTTFMNLSGQSVTPCAAFYKILPNQILVAHDEIDIPVGDIRLKFEGGHGGHNGLRDIIAKLGTKSFHRLRIGVDRPKAGGDVSDYVLHKPAKSERVSIDACLQKAITTLPLIVAGQFQKAMSTLHSS